MSLRRVKHRDGEGKRTEKISAKRRKEGSKEKKIDIQDKEKLQIKPNIALYR